MFAQIGLGVNKCKLSEYPTMLDESKMWGEHVIFDIEIFCLITIGIGLWIDLLHRGAQFFGQANQTTNSATTKFLWIKICVVLVYAVEVLIACMLAVSSTLDGFLVLSILSSRH